ncbi:MAG: transglutaminase domain-containing protein [Phycisphaerales bacterium]|nr:transglutaminase domain-containing protein [Phycisphaerales bacterium]MCI0630918.1 transglutaminase domain-containing protein [Phycisphaerales bacterium]MCI0675914.1 transglutaminase domain-containing protein [Phycisphaerales bacterium]
MKDCITGMSPAATRAVAGCGALLGAAVLCFVAAGFAPPSGRPPIGALERCDPRVYDVNVSVTIATIQQVNALDRGSYDLVEAPIVMPVIYMGTFSKVHSDSIAAKLWLESKDANPQLLIKSGYPHNTHLATLTVDKFEGQSLRWQVGFRAQVWSSRIDEKEAGEIGWPKEWPAEVQDGLQPQMYVQSDDPMFEQEVQKISQGKLRLVPPYLAAKDIVRHCVNEIQVSGVFMERGEFKVIRGLNITSAREAALKQRGTPNDLVCVCIAMLRAAGIPARPVIGVEEDDEDGKGSLVSWGEFYLPEAGWVPFDPNLMRGRGVRTLDVRREWPEFGGMENLNRRIPLAYHFIPPASVESPEYPAVWGWDPRPGKDPGSRQQITIGITSRGRGEEDPK